MGLDIDYILTEIRATLYTGLPEPRIHGVSNSDQLFLASLAYILGIPVTQLYTKLVSKAGPKFNFHDMGNIQTIISKLVPISLIVFEDSPESPMYGYKQTPNPILCASAINMNKYTKSKIGIVYMHVTKDREITFLPYTFYDEGYKKTTPLINSNSKAGKLLIDFYNTKCVNARVSLEKRSSYMWNEMFGSKDYNLKGLGFGKKSKPSESRRIGIENVLDNYTIYIYDLDTNKITCNNMGKNPPKAIIVLNKIRVKGEDYYRPYSFDGQTIIYPSDKSYKQILQTCSSSATTLSSSSDSDQSLSSSSSSDSIPDYYYL